MKMSQALAISLLIHISPILLFMAKAPPPQGYEEKRVGEFVQKKVEPLRIKIVATKKASIALPKTVIPEPAPKEEACKNHYFGLGYMIDAIQGNWCVVGTVAMDSPLDRANIMTGDKIQQDETGCPGQGPDGTDVTIIVLKKSGDIRTIDIKRAKICTED